MRDNCFEIGTIQAFLDGELASDAAENVARHIADCDACALSLAEAEDETAIAFSALENELNTLVPTQRLWLKINDSIEQKQSSFWQKVFAFISTPTSLALAGLLIVFGLFAAVLNFQQTDKFGAAVAQNDSNKQNAMLPVSEPVVNTVQSSQNDKLPEITKTHAAENKEDYKVIKTALEKPEKIRKVIDQPKLAPEKSSSKTDDELQAANNELRIPNDSLSGEDSYLKTIASLTKTVDTKKDETLKPSARFAFEKDLAVINDAIEKMQTEIKKNPKDETAKEMLRTSYQNKIDLLNSVTEKSELMASLK